MTEYALIINGQFQEIRRYDVQPPDILHKGIVWLPVLRKQGPEEFTGGRQETVEGKSRRWYVIATLSPEFIPAPPPPVPETITRRQCALELYARQMVTAQEALEMTKAGAVPAAIAAIFEAELPTVDARILAEIDFAATSYYRNNALLAMMGMTSEQLDQFFIDAAKR